MSEQYSEDAKHIEKLYEFDERLSESTDKSQNVQDYEGIIELSKTNIKTKQLGAQLIPRYFKFFTSLATEAFDAYLDIFDEVEVGVRVQAIRGLPLFCKDTPDFISKIIDVLVQCLNTEEFVERDAVHKALMSLFRQDTKASLTALFKHTEATLSTDEQIREKVLHFIRDKVFPLKGELLKPQQEMERHITDLIKKSLGDVTGEEFNMFMDFLKSLSIFGGKAPQERMQELVEIIEGQADLDSEFNRGAPGSKFLNYLNKNIMPAFDQLPEERKLNLLRALAEMSPYTTAQVARQILPSIVQLLKAPNATNSLCGYKIVTGQPSDRLGEDFSEFNKEFTERLTSVEDLTKATMKKLTQGMSEHSKAMSTAKTDEEKSIVKTKKQSTTTGLRTCNNILAMTKVTCIYLFNKSRVLANMTVWYVTGIACKSAFIYRKHQCYSFLERTHESDETVSLYNDWVQAKSTLGKRPANGAGNNVGAKKARVQNQQQVVNKRSEGISHGGGRGSHRGRGRGQGQGRHSGGGGGRGRGRRGFW
ncbi:Hypothetical protein [Arabidopsis thaliana]|uniref:F28N24.26 protein n=1 Tax=Arabidopsis thaliana TaxID=3702 RepID=Q9LP33_ARATH|nr:Hypothetical protein [Arabidopsis thaliana]